MRSFRFRDRGNWYPTETWKRQRFVKKINVSISTRIIAFSRRLFWPNLIHHRSKHFSKLYNVHARAYVKIVLTSGQFLINRILARFSEVGRKRKLIVNTKLTSQFPVQSRWFYRYGSSSIPFCIHPLIDQYSILLIYHRIKYLYNSLYREISNL